MAMTKKSSGKKSPAKKAAPSNTTGQKSARPSRKK